MSEANVFAPGRQESTTAGFLRIEPLRYARLHLLFILAAVLDITFTWIILSKGGHEVNPVAELILVQYGFNGMILFKFALVTFIIVCTEVVGRQKPGRGMMLASLTPIVTMVPVFYAIRELLITFT